MTINEFPNKHFKHNPVSPTITTYGGELGSTNDYNIYITLLTYFTKYE